MSLLGRRLREAGGDRGSSAIEAVAAIFLLGTIVLVTMQVVWFMVGSSIAQQAARDGARALSLGQSASVAVARSVPDRTTYRVWYPSPDTVRVRVDMKGTIFPLQIERQMTMPRTAS